MRVKVHKKNIIALSAQNFIPIFSILISYSDNELEVVLKTIFIYAVWQLFLLHKVKLFQIYEN